MIGRQHAHVLLVLQNIAHQRGQHALRPDFHEHARAHRVHRLHRFDELHWRGQLQGQHVQNLLALSRIQVAGHVRDDGGSWRLNILARDNLPQRDAGRGNDAAMEGMRDGNLDRLIALREEGFHGCVHGARLAGDDRL